MAKPKIIVRLKGGLGNQLFCYAAARRLALVSNAELVIDDVSGFTYDHDYKRQYQLNYFSIPCRKAAAAERLEPFSRVRRYLKRRRNARLPFEQRSYIQQEGIDFDPRLLQVKPRGTLYLEGYWQSESYFKDVEATIRADLRITSPIDALNQGMAARIRNSLAVALHVRFFDAPNKAGINNVTGDYYARAVTQMETLAPDAHYFVFSDQRESVRARIPLSDDRITCVSHNQGDTNAYADLWLMTQCRHFIIANSTFSWWGAWLAAQKPQIVIAPGINKLNGVTSWGFIGQIPASWIKL
jgi:hypothetical protein